MPKLNPIQIRNLGVYGLIRQPEVEDNLIPDGAVTESINVHFDRKGAVTLRNGYTIIGSQISNDYSCLGLFNSLFSDSSKNCLLAVFSDGTNNDIYKSTGGAWSKSLEDDTKDLKTRFVSFANRTIRVNGTDAVKCFNGTTWETTGNPINPDTAPIGKYIEVFKSKIYILTNTRLNYSETVDSSGYITWDTANNYTDINPNDGEIFSGLKRFATQLLVFKPNYIYRFNTSGTDPDPLIKVGTRSNESIVEGKKGIYFHHDTGFYLYGGDYPENISLRISDIVKAIPLSYYDDISGWSDNDHIYWSVGDLTIDGESWTNVICRYTESSKVWTIYSTADEIVWGAPYNNGTSILQVVGDNDGKIYTFDSGTTDNTTPIKFRMMTKWYELDSIFNRKTIQQINTLCLKALETHLSYQVDDWSLNHFEPIGQITKWQNYFKNLNIKGHRIRFKISGVSSQEAFIFMGIILVDLSSEFNVE